MKIGAFDYLLKPFKAEALLPVLSRAVGVRRLRLENVRLHETVAFYELAKTVAYVLDLDTILDKLADGALQQCQADEASLMLPTRDGGELYVAAVRGEGRDDILGQRVPMDRGIAGWVASHQEPLTLQGDVDDQRFAPLAPRKDIGAAISMPMLVGGKLIGVVNVSSKQRRPFSLGQVKGLGILTSTAAGALEHARLYAETRDAEQRYRSLAQRLSAIGDFARTVSSTLDLDVLFEAALQQVVALTGCGWCNINEYDGRDNLFRMVAVWRQGGEGSRDLRGTFSPEQSSSGVVLRTRRPHAVQDIEQRHEVTERGRSRSGNIRSRISVPVIIGDDFWGTANVGFSEAGAATPDRVEFLEAVAAHLAVAIHNAELYSQLQGAHEELKETQHRVVQQERLGAIGQMASGIAHDFNNLLTAIIGFGTLLQAQLDLGEPQRTYLAEMTKAGERAALLTQQLLAFSRQQVLRPEILDLNAVAATVDKLLERVIGEDVKLTTVLEPKLGCVRADLGQMEQVILNLAVNARDAMPTGGRLTIETANVDLDETYTRERLGAQPGPHVLLAVTDTGVGMDAETEAHIFEPFFTTKEVGKGTGLGLATVYGIVKQSGGSIWVYSEPGRGSTFKIYLPRVDEAAPTPGPSDPAGIRNGWETILLVEDEEGVRLLVSEVLRANGYTVLEAPNGAEGQRICERYGGPIHLLLTDVVMPEMSGRELAEVIGRLRPELRVIYMSGYTSDTVIRHGVLEQGLRYLEKPFTPEELTRMVRQTVDEAPGATR
ncbi:MAG: multi-sensor hybrid histidine kinase [Chloroflexi bacterium]|nr:multi-sensor hybrid histidine kinase [Chloroflexota bacterium]